MTGSMHDEEYKEDFLNQRKGIHGGILFTYLGEDGMDVRSE